MAILIKNPEVERKALAFAPDAPATRTSGFSQAP
jgi:hypothetical protein